MWQSSARARPGCRWPGRWATRASRSSCSSASISAALVFNFGCTPSKGFIASARAAYQARRAAEYGVVVPSVAVDFGAVIRRARRLAEESRISIEESFAREANPRIVMSTARLDGREGALFRVVAEDGEIVLASQVVLNTGTREARPDLPGLDTIQAITGGNWLQLARTAVASRLPRRRADRHRNGAGIPAPGFGGHDRRCRRAHPGARGCGRRGGAAGGAGPGRSRVPRECHRRPGPRRQPTASAWS